VVEAVRFGYLELAFDEEAVVGGIAAVFDAYGIGC
jgi:hypothetical protein